MDNNLWTPDCSALVNSLDEVVDAYEVWLEVRHPTHVKLFRDRIGNDPDAARSEAAVFSWIRAAGLRPDLEEVPGSGGMDFCCEPKKGDRLFIEVTSLNAESVELRSGWPNELDETCRWFENASPSAWSKVKNKAGQLVGPGFSKILVVCLNHVGGSALLGTMAAQWLATGKQYISVRPDGGSVNATDLEKSAFLRLHNGEVELTRRNISALLMCCLRSTTIEVVGILHPSPSIPMNLSHFERVPFLQIEWPIRDGRMETKWVLANPDPCVVPLCAVQLESNELKGQ